MLVGGKTKTESELCIVLEQGVRPRWPTAFVVLGPRRHWEIAAIDRRAAGSIGDLQAIAEKLGEKFQIRRLAAAGARSGELEQRLQELYAAHIGEVDAGAIIYGERLEKSDVVPLGINERRFIGHVDGFHVRLARAHGRAASTHSAQPVQSSM